MFTFVTVSIILFRKNGNAWSFTAATNHPTHISPSIIDKLEQSYFATGYM